MTHACIGEDGCMFIFVSYITKMLRAFISTRVKFFGLK